MISDPAAHWNLFDAHCVVGRHLRLQAGGLHTADDLLREMDHYGIAEALVTSSVSREVHPLDGNPQVAELANGQPRLHAAWVLVPPGTDEQPAPADLVEQMRAQQVGAGWLLPKQYRFRLCDWCLDDLLAPLAEARVPLFISYVESGPQGAWQNDVCDWNEVVGLCRRWPTLPVIVSEFRIRYGQRQAYRALDACPNLRLELSGYWLAHGIEYLTQRWGAERVVFGSNWPGFGQHMTMAPLTCAEIDDADKRLIAGDNLRQLLSWADLAHPAYTPPAAADDYVAVGRAGRSPGQVLALPEPAWDCHGHLGGTSSHYHVPDGSVDGAVAEMDRLGVERVCVFSFAGVTGDERYGNDLVAAAVARHPDRFVGFTLLNPHRGRDEMWRELERGAAMGLRGVKLIPHYQGYPEEGPLVDVGCEWAHAHQQLILNHHWGSPAQMERLVSTYPEACFIAGHTTTAYAEVMARHDNLYVCSCPLLEPRACENVVAAIGADRFMFGSDLLDLPIAWGLGPIVFARLAPADKQLILGGNLRRLLERYSRV